MIINSPTNLKLKKKKKTSLIKLKSIKIKMNLQSIYEHIFQTISYGIENSHQLERDQSNVT